MQVKVLAAPTVTVPVIDPTNPGGVSAPPPTPPGSGDPGSAQNLNYLGPNPVATPGPFFTGIFNQRMQQVMKDPDTGYLYQAQGRDGGAVGDLGNATIEDTAISRFSPSGILLDSMVLVDGGHGFSTNLEHRGAGLSPWVWGTWAAPNGGAVTNVVCRVPYTPGQFTYNQVAGLQTFSSMGSVNPNVAMDWRNDWMVFLDASNPASFTYTRHKISEYKAGTTTVYNTVFTGTSDVLQGFFTYQNSLFVFTGGANDPVKNPVLLREFDWQTGAVVQKFDASRLGRLSNGKYPGDWYEPEGAFLYDVDGTSPQALIGMTYYPYGKHQSQYFSIPLRTQAQAIGNQHPVTSKPPVPIVPPTINTNIGVKHISAVNPVHMASLHPATNDVLQCLVHMPTLGSVFFTTQATAGTNGSHSPYENVVISRLNANGTLLDSMTLHDAGHGTSFGVNNESGVAVIYMNYQTLNNDLISFTYTPGTFDNSNLPNMVTWPKLDHGYDNLQFDWDNDLMVVRNSSGTRDSYIRRQITDWKADIDLKYEQIDLQQGPPVLQGFCTINDALFRLIGGGSGASGNDKKTYIQEYSWDSGLLVDQKDFTTIGRSAHGTYPGGYYEPEGCSMYRESDGSATLIFSVTFGSPTHSYEVYKFPKIGDSKAAFNLADPGTALKNGTESPLG